MELFDPITDPRSAPDTAHIPALTVFDRCDAPDCSSQAYVRARLRSGRYLDFCGHHGHDLIPALAGQGAVIRDDSHLLVEDRLRSGAGKN
jgi:hypothetical protein